MSDLEPIKKLAEILPRLRTKIHPTTAQSLGALVKSARDIMRKDKGLNGDLDRLPMLTFRSSRREEARSEESEARTPKSECSAK